jgi:hypothetical protein
MKTAFGSNQIFAHRGFWSTGIVANSSEAFLRAAEYGFGIETDLRNDDRGVWVAHDPADLKDRIEASLTLNLGVPVALNIKSDGLGSFGLEHLPKILASGSFFFDGSLPQMLDFRRKNIPHALRISEYEMSLPWTPDYIWLDCFEGDWWISDLNIFEIFPNPNFVVVSSELHNRNPNFMWDAIYQLDAAIRDRIMVCTDRPVDFIQWDQ